MYTSHDFDDVIEPAQHISKCQTNINIPNSNSPSATSIQPNQSTQLMQTRIQPITLAKLLQQQGGCAVIKEFREPNRMHNTGHHK